MMQIHTATLVTHSIAKATLQVQPLHTGEQSPSIPMMQQCTVSLVTHSTAKANFQVQPLHSGEQLLSILLVYPFTTTLVSHSSSKLALQVQLLHTSVIAINPNHTNAHCNLGAVLYKQDNSASAAAACQAALAMDPHDARAKQLLAQQVGLPSS
jgi:hypothetical protein